MSLPPPKKTGPLRGGGGGGGGEAAALPLTRGEDPELRLRAFLALLIVGLSSVRGRGEEEDSSSRAMLATVGCACWRG